MLGYSHSTSSRSWSLLLLAETRKGPQVEAMNFSIKCFANPRRVEKLMRELYNDRLATSLLGSWIGLRDVFGLARGFSWANTNYVLMMKVSRELLYFGNISRPKASLFFIHIFRLLVSASAPDHVNQTHCNGALVWVKEWKKLNCLFQESFSLFGKVALKIVCETFINSRIRSRGGWWVEEGSDRWCWAKEHCARFLFLFPGKFVEVLANDKVKRICFDVCADKTYLMTDTSHPDGNDFTATCAATNRQGWAKEYWMLALHLLRRFLFPSNWPSNWIRFQDRREGKSW